MITKRQFNKMGTMISFIPYGNNPEDEIDGLAYSYAQVKLIKDSLFDKKNICEHKYIVLTDIVRERVYTSKTIGAMMVCEKCLDLKKIMFKDDDVDKESEKKLEQGDK